MTCVEFGHLFAGQDIGLDQLETQQIAAQYSGADYVVLVDDYSAPAEWNPTNIAVEYSFSGVAPVQVFALSDIAEYCDAALARLTLDRQREIAGWQRGSSRQPMTLLIATWNAIRLGLIESPPDRLTGKPIAPKDELVSILPDNCKWVESEAKEILEELGARESTLVHHWIPVSNPWEAFNPEAYAEESYAVPQQVDLELAQLLSSAWSRKGRVDRTLEVGTGANLYPALAALTHSDHVVLSDYCQANLDWIADQQRRLDPHWLEFGSTPLPVTELQQLLWNADLVRVSLFELSSLAEQWPVIQMFFVIDSITSSRDELQQGLRELYSALKPDGSLFAVFTLGSRGYCLARSAFPATYLTEAELGVELEKVGFEEIRISQARGEAFREGYDSVVFVEATKR